MITRLAFIGIFFLVWGCQPKKGIPTPDTTVHEQPGEGEIFVAVTDPPRFPGCEDNLLTKEKRAKCAKEKLHQFIHRTRKYPQQAVNDGIEGEVLIRCVIQKDGMATHASIMHDIGSGCGEAALKAVQQMPQWIPGRQNGKPVAVYVNIPVKFFLE